MAKVPINCATTQGNVSKAQCTITIKEAQVLLLAAPGFKFGMDEYKDEEIIEGYIAQKLLRPIHVVNLMENTSAGDITEEVGGNEYVVKHGEGRFKYQVTVSQCGYTDLKSLEQRINSTFDAYIVDKSNKIIGEIADDGSLYPLPVNSFTVAEPPITSDGVTITKYSVTIRFDYEEIAFSSVGYFETGLLWKTIDGLTDVDLSDASNSGAVVTVSVKTSCGATDVTGLVDGDFASIDSGNPALSAVETAPGIYDVTYTSALTPGEEYSVELKAPDFQVTKLYETSTAATFTAV